MEDLFKLKRSCFKVDIKPISNNEVRSMHFGAYKTLKHRYGWTIEAGNKMLVDPIPPATGPKDVRTLKIIVYRSRLFDKNNFIGGLKPFVDAIVEVGLLWDDRPSCCVELDHEQKKNADEFRDCTIICIGYKEGENE